VKYKRLEAYAVMHALFYKRIIAVVLSLALLSLVLISAFVLSYGPLVPVSGTMNPEIRWTAAGACGGLTAVVMVYFLSYPVKFLSKIWVWPGIFGQIVLILCCSLLGLVLRRWKYAR